MLYKCQRWVCIQKAPVASVWSIMGILLLATPVTITLPLAGPDEVWWYFKDDVICFSSCVVEFLT